MKRGKKLNSVFFNLKYSIQDNLLQSQIEELQCSLTSNLEFNAKLAEKVAGLEESSK